MFDRYYRNVYHIADKGHESGSTRDNSVYAALRIVDSRTRVGEDVCARACMYIFIV